MDAFDIPQNRTFIYTFVYDGLSLVFAAACNTILFVYYQLLLVISVILVSYYERMIGRKFGKA